MYTQVHSSASGRTAFFAKRLDGQGRVRRLEFRLVVVGAESKAYAPVHGVDATTDRVTGCLGRHYDSLGVPRNATPDEIKAAYRQKAKELHPDVNKQADAPQRFIECTEAYTALTESTWQAQGSSSMEARAKVGQMHRAAQPVGVARRPAHAAAGTRRAPQRSPLDIRAMQRLAEARRTATRRAAEARRDAPLAAEARRIAQQAEEARRALQEKGEAVKAAAQAAEARRAAHQAEEARRALQEKVEAVMAAAQAVEARRAAHHAEQARRALQEKAEAVKAAAQAAEARRAAQQAEEACQAAGEKATAAQAVTQGSAGACRAAAALEEAACFIIEGEVDDACSAQQRALVDKAAQRKGRACREMQAANMLQQQQQASTKAVPSTDVGSFFEREESAHVAAQGAEVDKSQQQQQQQPQEADAAAGPKAQQTGGAAQPEKKARAMRRGRESHAAGLEGGEVLLAALQAKQAAPRAGKELVMSLDGCHTGAVDASGLARKRDGKAKLAQCGVEATAGVPEAVQLKPRPIKSAPRATKVPEAAGQAAQPSEAEQEEMKGAKGADSKARAPGGARRGKVPKAAARAVTLGSVIPLFEAIKVGKAAAAAHTQRVIEACAAMQEVGDARAAVLHAWAVLLGQLEGEGSPPAEDVVAACGCGGLIEVLKGAQQDMAQVGLELGAGVSRAAQEGEEMRGMGATLDVMEARMAGVIARWEAELKWATQLGAGLQEGGERGGGSTPQQAQEKGRICKQQVDGAAKAARRKAGMQQPASQPSEALVQATVALAEVTATYRRKRSAEKQAAEKEARKHKKALRDK